MSKQFSYVVGIFFIVVLGVGLWFLLGTTKPQEADIDAIKQTVTPVNANLLSDTSMKNINDKKIYGDLPVPVETNYQNSDLFN